MGLKRDCATCGQIFEVMIIQPNAKNICSKCKKLKGIETVNKEILVSPQTKKLLQGYVQTTPAPTYDVAIGNMQNTLMRMAENMEGMKKELHELRGPAEVLSIEDARPSDD